MGLPEVSKGRRSVLDIWNLFLTLFLEKSLVLSCLLVAFLASTRFPTNKVPAAVPSQMNKHLPMALSPTLLTSWVFCAVIVRVSVSVSFSLYAYFLLQGLGLKG